LTAHAGLALLRDFVEKLALPQLLDEEVEVKQRQRGYPESDNILSLCWNAISGGDSLRDLAVLRGDAGVCDLIGVDSVMAPTTAGEFLRQFDLGDLCDLRRALRLAAERVRPLQKSDRVTIDLDASLYEQCSKNKEGSRMNYKGEVGYYPLFAFWAEEQELLATHLLRGNAHAAPKSVYLLKQALLLVAEGKPVYLRADSEFYTWPLIEMCEQNRITYAITADMSKQLRKKIEGLANTAWRHYAKGAEVAELRYAPTGHSEHRYIIKRQWVVEKNGVAHWRYHAVITNEKGRSAKKVMKWALGRCAMENLIKEHKRDFGFEKMPTKKYHANWAWLLISQLAWNVVAWFKRVCLPQTCHKMTVGTLRHRLFRVAGKIVQRSRQLFLVISEENQFKDWWRFALKKLAALNPISP
jgi:hypothetical protein